MRRILFSISFLLPLTLAHGWAQTLADRAKPYLDAALAANQSFVVVSSASATPVMAPGSLATAFGPALASRTETGTPPYPTSLGGIGLQTVDSGGQSKAAQLLYVSPTQINFLIPASSAAGTATINIINGTGNVPSGSAQLQVVAPALFTANASGQGVVAATATRRVIPSNFSSPVAVFQCPSGPGSCVSVPIDPGVDAPVTVTLYGTGLKGRSSDAAVMVKIGGQTVAASSVLSTDPTDALAGIDQVTFGLPLSLRGSGEVDVVLVVDGVMSNAGRINIQ